MIAARVPPFSPGGAHLYKRRKSHNDFMTALGANELCHVIESAWRSVGHPEVKATPVVMAPNENVSSELDKSYYTIQITGLINGVPVAR